MLQFQIGLNDTKQGYFSLEVSKATENAAHAAGGFSSFTALSNEVVTGAMRSKKPRPRSSRCPAQPPLFIRASRNPARLSLPSKGLTNNQRRRAAPLHSSAARYSNIFSGCTVRRMAIWLVPSNTSMR